MDDTYNEFLGTGWGFPPTFSKTNKSVEMVEGQEDIAQGLKIILLTKTGERLFHPQMGTNLDDFFFTKKVDVVIQNRIKQMVENVIYEFEPRVDVENVKVEFDDKEYAIIITITYTIKAFNTTHNIVFPYYIDKGINS